MIDSPSYIPPLLASDAVNPIHQEAIPNLNPPSIQLKRKRTTSNVSDYSPEASSSSQIKRSTKRSKNSGRRWLCPTGKCDQTFRGSYEADRHASTAVKCSGQKRECPRCGKGVADTTNSLNRHQTSKRCKRESKAR